MDAPRGFDAHLFVCTNKRASGEASCGMSGGDELRAALKKAVAERPHWKGRVRVNMAGCLGFCEQGVVAVVYPSGKWLTRLKGQDVDACLAAIEAELGRT